MVFCMGLKLVLDPVHTAAHRHSKVCNNMSPHVFFYLRGFLIEIVYVLSQLLGDVKMAVFWVVSPFRLV
jgi:hypothetical protein